MQRRLGAQATESECGWREPAARSNLTGFSAAPRPVSPRYSSLRRPRQRRACAATPDHAPSLLPPAGLAPREPSPQGWRECALLVRPELGNASARTSLLRKLQL